MLYFSACPRRLAFSEDTRTKISLFPKAATEILSDHWEAHHSLREPNTKITSETAELKSHSWSAYNFQPTCQASPVQAKQWDCNSSPEKCCPRAQAELYKKRATNFPQTIFFFLAVGLPAKGKHIGQVAHTTTATLWNSHQKDRSSIRKQYLNFLQNVCDFLTTLKKQTPR